MFHSKCIIFAFNANKRSSLFNLKRDLLEPGVEVEDLGVLRQLADLVPDELQNSFDTTGVEIESSIGYQNTKICWML